MSMSHTDCDHPSTSSARAKCRRDRGKGQGSAGKGGSSREVDFSTVDAPKRGEGPTYGAFRSRTPRDRALACDNCGVERLRYRGTDPLTGVLKFVGPRCYYIIQWAPDIVDLGKKAKREKPADSDLDTEVEGG